MPAGRIYRYKAKKRPRSRKTNFSGFKKSGLLSAPLPQKLKAALKYNDTYNLNPGVGGTADVQVISLNGCYDPDTTGVGHQPRGFDELFGSSGLYTHYEVMKVQIKAYFANRDNNYHQYCSMTVRDGVSVASSANDYIESGSTKWTVVGTEGSSDNVRYLQVTLQPNKWLGRNRGDDELKGNASGNPAEQLYAHISCAPLQAQDASPVDVALEVTYFIECTEPIKLVQS